MKSQLRLAMINKDTGYIARQSKNEKIRNDTLSTKLKDFCGNLEAKSYFKRISCLIKATKKQLGTLVDLPPSPDRRIRFD